MQRLRSIPSYSTPPAKQSIAGPLYATASASEPRLSPREGARSPNPALSRSKASASTLLQSTKRRDTGAHEYMQHYATSPRSVRSSPGLGDESLQIIDAADALDAEPPMTEDDSFEGLENVRVCCVRCASSRVLELIQDRASTTSVGCRRRASGKAAARIITTITHIMTVARRPTRPSTSSRTVACRSRPRRRSA